MFLQSHTHELGRDVTVFKFDGKTTGEEIYRNDDWQTPKLKSFNVPATLFCTFKSTTDAQASDIYWWDPGAKVWRVVPSTLAGSTRSALLWHFSKYSAGRAGW